MKFPGLIFCLLLLQLSARAQFAPQAGLPGSTAISAASTQFVGWATQCRLYRGLQDIADPTLGYTSIGDSSAATGPADRDIVSMGDSGVAVLTFAQPIYNGAGPDFAVFENGFSNPADASQAFLELAFVEVSSDGIHFFRFPAISNTQTNTQIAGSGVYMDASLINNLAGKYTSMYGTPFDLQELAGTAGLDINSITHVRIVDVIGSVGSNATQDATGHIINDPYPTNFPSGGFDLDAVGAIYQSATAVSGVAANSNIQVFPNPATDNITIAIKGDVPAGTGVQITTAMGNIVYTAAITENTSNVSVAIYPAGIYYLIFSDSNGSKWTEKIVKY